MSAVKTVKCENISIGSEAVSSTSTSSSIPCVEISPTTLYSVSKQVLVGEELSKNSKVFGLSEVDSKAACNCVMKSFLKSQNYTLNI